jgi:hypothetical protein
MRTAQHWLAILLLFLLAIGVTGRVTALTVAQQGNQLLLNGQPTPVTFARNCTNVADLTAYHDLGFNTLLVTINSPEKKPLAAANALMTAAEQHGLFVLVELANGAWDNNQYADLHDKDFLDGATFYLDTVIPALQKHANLIGWIISTADERQFTSTVGTFRSYLAKKYGTIDALNSVWCERDANGQVVSTAGILSFAMIPNGPVKTFLKTLGGSKFVHDRAAEDAADYQQVVDARDGEFQTFLQARYKSMPDLTSTWMCDEKWTYTAWKDITVASLLGHEHDNIGMSLPALIDLACMQSTDAPAIMDWWAKAVSKRDGDHLVFAGGQHSYRTLITLPHSLNGALTECYPGYTEADWESQNPHAVDMARRGNQFIVLAGVLAQICTPGDLANAVYSAAVHGAAGICVTDWTSLRQRDTSGGPSYTKTLSASLHDLIHRNLLNRIPTPGVAIVYGPYAPGPYSMLNHVYGYLPSFVYPGPGLMFFTLRNGTSFGQFDYLSAYDLAHVSLSNYRCILLLSALDVPQQAQDALVTYAKAGGTVLADLGAGTVQADDNYCFLPPTLMQLFNVITDYPHVDEQHLNLEVTQPNADFPSLMQGVCTNGIADGYMINFISKAVPLAGTQLLFSTVATNTMTLPVVTLPQPLAEQDTRGMFIFKQNTGMAIYAPFPLYDAWMPDSMLFGEFHHDLLGHNAAICLQRPIDFVPAEAEVANYADGTVIAWSKDQTAPQVIVRNTARRLYLVQGGECGLDGSLTTLNYETAGFQLAEPLPITVSALTFPLTISALRVNKQTIELTLAANGNSATGPVTLSITDGAYPVAPNSTHHVTINTQDGPQSSSVTADDQGILTLTLPTPNCQLHVGDTAPAKDDKNTSDEHPFDDTPITPKS